MQNIIAADAELGPAGLLAANALPQRPARAPNLRAQAAAFCELSELLVTDPREALRRVPKIALHLCEAGTAGISLLRIADNGQPVVYWKAVDGALAGHEGDETPRNFSQCGLCLDTGATILVAHPERVFTYLSAMRPAIVEALIAPLHDKDKRPLGTIWIAHHHSACCFSADDALILEQLAIYPVLALKLLKTGRKRRNALASLESHKVAGRVVAHDLTEERVRRERAENSESGIRQAMMVKNAVILEVHHRVRNTIQMATGLLSTQARASSSVEVRAALQECHERLNVLAKVHELLYRSADSAQQVFMPTLLTAIGDALRQSFGISSRVQLSVIADQIVLSPDDAIPMALLANEAITNAYKHAFPNGACGEITVTLRHAGDRRISLQIKDSGIGVHGGGGDGMGLTLIRGFGAQLHGTLDFSSGHDAVGTVVTLTILRGDMQA